MVAIVAVDGEEVLVLDGGGEMEKLFGHLMFLPLLRYPEAAIGAIDCERTAFSTRRDCGVECNFNQS